ncbi:MAG: ABC transporter ATP-binding protein [Candidatus Rokubacteria bacterium]|nr:ABC transporter ATP-binding protein [Candidatus Rokubacteria bacterium]
MLEVRELYAGYYRELHILRGVSIAVRPGTVTAVLGANGVGKSTLLKAIFGFLVPARGQVLLDATDITGTPPHRMIERGVAYGPQQPGIFSEMTVEENITIGAWTFRRDARRLRRKLEENYERFPLLRERRQSRAGELSGGQRRMVELARALMSNPRYLLIDEPSAGVAPVAAAGVYATLQALRGEGVGVVLVDQDIRRALQVADYVYVIDLGQNRLEGTPAELGDIEAVFWQATEPGRPGPTGSDS